MASFEDQYVSFILGEGKYALSLLNVIEVVKTSEITEVPKALDFVKGIIHLRSKVVPVIDLRKRFAMAGINIESGDNKNMKIIVSKAGSKHIGFIVDDVLKVITINKGNIEKPPTGQSTSETFVKGIAKIGEDLIVIIDSNNLLKSYEESDITNL